MNITKQYAIIDLDLDIRIYFKIIRYYLTLVKHLDLWEGNFQDDDDGDDEFQDNDDDTAIISEYGNGDNDVYDDYGHLIQIRQQPVVIKNIAR